jgi:hypothetical protein
MATHATLLPQCDEQELKARRQDVASMLGTTLAEGMAPSPEALSLFNSYANGDIRLDEIIPAIRALDEI